MGLQSMLKDMGIKVTIEVLTDASAAKGIATRRGLSSRTRHVAVHFLWLQERVAAGQIKILKVKGDINPADLLTKYLTRDIMLRHMATARLALAEGRAHIAPALSHLAECIHSPSVHSKGRYEPRGGVEPCLYLTVRT